MTFQKYHTENFPRRFGFIRSRSFWFDKQLQYFVSRIHILCNNCCDIKNNATCCHKKTGVLWPQKDILLIWRMLWPRPNRNVDIDDRRLNPQLARLNIQEYDYIICKHSLMYCNYVNAIEMVIMAWVCKDKAQVEGNTDIGNNMWPIRRGLWKKKSLCLLT